MSIKLKEEIDILLHNQPHASTSIGRDFENTNSSTETEKTSQSIKSIIRIRCELLSNRSLNIFEEDNYISILMTFIEVQEKYKSGEDVNDLNYQSNETTVINLPHFVGSLQRKLEMRSSILQKLLQHCKNEIMRSTISILSNL